MNRTKCIVVIMTLFHVVGCASAPSKPVPTARFAAWTGEGFNGRRISTDHFEIISTLADAALEEGLPTFLEDAYQTYAKTLPIDGTGQVSIRGATGRLLPAAAQADEPPVAPELDQYAIDSAPNQPLTTYVFGLRDEWLRFTRVRFPQRSEVYARIRSGGFTEGTTSVSFYTNRGVTLATLAHEGWHQYVNARLDRPIPAWLNEGLACTFESFDMKKGRPHFDPRRNSFRINSLREAIQSDTLLSLREIVDTDAGEVILNDRSQTTDTYYAQAWALITFLRYGAGGRYAASFDRMMSDIADGTFHARISAARLTDKVLPNSLHLRNLPEPQASTCAIRPTSTAQGSLVSQRITESIAQDPDFVVQHAPPDTRDLTTPITDGRAAFIAYFQSTPEELQTAYYDHLIRIAGY